MRGLKHITAPQSGMAGRVCGRTTPLLQGIVYPARRTFSHPCLTAFTRGISCFTCKESQHSVSGSQRQMRHSRLSSLPAHSPGQRSCWACRGGALTCGLQGAER